MEAVGTSETLVSLYQITRHKFPEDTQTSYTSPWLPKKISFCAFFEAIILWYEEYFPLTYDRTSRAQTSGQNDQPESRSVALTVTTLVPTVTFSNTSLL